MSPEDQFAFERLTEAEKVIKALETLADECAGRGLDTFVKRITTCIEQCQNDYVTLQRELYRKSSGGGSAPPPTEH